MKRRRAIVCVTATAAVWLLAVVLASGQAPESKTPMAEEVFKNIRVLKGIPVDDFLGTMGIMCAALGFDCSDCHTGAGTEKVDWAAETVKKATALRAQENQGLFALSAR